MHLGEAAYNHTAFHFYIEKRNCAIKRTSGFIESNLKEL